MRSSLHDSFGLDKAWLAWLAEWPGTETACAVPDMCEVIKHPQKEFLESCMMLMRRIELYPDAYDAR